MRDELSGRMSIERFFEHVQGECIRARRKFPSFNSKHEAYAVLLEEVDELWEAIKHNEPIERLREEIVQVAAMAACFACEMGSTPAKDEQRKAGGDA